MARTKTGFFFVKTIDGGPPARDWRYMKVGTAYHEGAVVRLSPTSGSAGRIANLGTLAYGVLGAAVPTGHAGAVKAPIYLADNRNLFEAKMVATSTTKLRVGDKYGVVLTTTHNYRIEGTARTGNATAAVRPVAFHPDDTTAGAASNRYWVKFVPSASLTDGDNVIA